ncbi:MAG: hypothetical protein U0694_21485 [Anaerolineae bacterium]
MKRIVPVGLVLWGMCLLLAMAARLGGGLVPEGAQLAFVALEDDSTATIYILDVRRELVLPLVTGVDRTLSFARDGQLVYSQRVSSDASAVFRMDGLVTQQLSPEGARDHYPVWSPDGQQVAFIAIDGSQNVLYVMNADGSERRRLASEDCPNILTLPQWLPDSRGIIFRYGSPEIRMACVVDSRSGDIWDFSHDTDVHSIPVWAADGRHIVFAVETLNFAQLYVAALDEHSISGVTRVTDDTLSFNTMPSWSADGTQIIFISNRSGNRDVYLMNADGSQLRNLSQSSANEFYPMWSPDGKEMAFMANAEGRWSITLMRADGTDARHLIGEMNVRLVSMMWLP